MNGTHTYRSSTKTQRVASAAAWVLVVLCALAGSALAGEKSDKTLKANSPREHRIHPDHRDTGHVKAVTGAGKSVKLSSKPGPGSPNDKASQIEASRVTTLVTKAATKNKQTKKSGKLKWVRRKRDRVEPPSPAGGTTLFRLLSKRLRRGQSEADPSMVEMPQNVASFANVYALRPGNGGGAERSKQPQRGPTQARASEVAFSGQVVDGHDQGLPRYALRLTGQAHVVRPLAAFMEAMGSECMPVLRKGKLAAAGTLLCLMPPGMNSLYEGKRQRLVDSLEGRLWGLVDEGLVSEDAVGRAGKVLRHPEALVVGADGVIRVSPGAAVKLLKATGWLGNGAADDHSYADAA